MFDKSDVRIETLLLATLRLLDRRTCAGFALSGDSRGKHESTYVTIMIFHESAGESWRVLPGFIYTLGKPD